MMLANAPDTRPAHRAPSGGPRGLLLLLPLLGVLSVMALTPTTRQAAAPPDQKFDARMQDPHFAPWWRVQLRQARGAVRRSRAWAESSRTPAEAACRRQALAVCLGQYNWIARQAPPETFTDPSIHRTLTMADTGLPRS